MFILDNNNTPELYLPINMTCTQVAADLQQVLAAMLSHSLRLIR